MKNILIAGNYKAYHGWGGYMPWDNKKLKMKMKKKLLYHNLCIHFTSAYLDG